MALILVAGQSNAIIPGVRAEELPAHLQLADSHVHIWTGDHFEILQPGVNTGGPNTPDAVGPEVAFAARWRAEHPGQDLYFVKSAKGSTGLAADPAELDWSPASRDELFDATTAKLRAAQASLAAAGGDPTLSAVLWIQGEQDATSAAKAGAYAINLPGLFAGIRSTWGDALTPIVVARLDGHLAAAFADEVREAQDQAVAAAGVVAGVDTDLLALQADGIHYNAAGAIGLGEELYSGLSALQHTSFGPSWAWPRGDFLVSDQ